MEKPCYIMSEYGERKKINVDCLYKCDRCGFNPQEQARRLSNGKFKPHSVWIDIYAADGRITRKKFDDVMSLHFKTN